MFHKVLLQLLLVDKQLTENVDYTVDYTLGRVKIINEGILNSGMPIKISLESNALFAIQQKRLLGAHLDYRINKDFTCRWYHIKFNRTAAYTKSKYWR
jgi:cell surface protein SprA